MIKPPDFCQTCRWLEGEACGLRKAHEINWASGRVYELAIKMAKEQIELE